MRKLFFYFAILIVALSCNDSSKKGAIDLSFLNSFVEDTSRNLSGFANVILPTKRSQAMILNYRNEFKKDPTDNSKIITALIDSIWLDKTTIDELAQLLKDKPSYIGYRVYHTSDASRYEVNTPMPYRDTTNIIFMPVDSSSTDGYSRVDTTFKKPSVITTKYLKDYAQAKTEMNHFNDLYYNGLTNYRKEKVHSKGVLFDRAAIKLLAKILSANISNGVNVYSASYFKKETDLPNGYVNKDFMQSTLIMVPTKVENGRTVSDWIILDLISEFLQQKWKYILGGLNHGELCPNSCG